LIDLLDDALRDFLLRELPVRENEIDISFDQPKREWSARLSRPTLNIFLRDVRENVKMRSPSPAGVYERSENSARFQRESVRLDLSYMMTAWAKDPLDEHRILSRLLAALFRFRGIPTDITAEHLPNLASDVTFKVSQPESAVSANDIWSVLDNEMRPFVDVIASMSLQPYAEEIYPLVRSLDITLVRRTGQVEQDDQIVPAPSRSDRIVRVTQVPNGRTPDAKRTSPPWPSESGGAPGPPAGDGAQKAKGGKGKK
jgi:hypothetical protein